MTRADPRVGKESSAFSMARAQSKSLTVIDAARVHRPIFPADFGAYSSLLWRLAFNAFRSKYLELKGSFVWYYVRPAVMTAVFVLLRNTGAAASVEDMPFALFVFTGCCFWFIFSETVTASASALTRDAGLIQKIYYPVIISPMAQALARLGDVALALTGVAVLQLAFGVGTDWELVLLAPAVLQLLLLALGVGCAFAALSLRTPDVREGLNIGLFLGLFLSPVFYAPSHMPEAARMILQINPMVGSLGAIRGALVADAAVPWAAWAYSWALTLVVLAIGLALFARESRNVAESL
jgi:lipopolysaccharide transport system permease protein